MLLKKTKIPKYIIDDIEISCDTNEENSDEETLLNKIQAEKNSDYEENFDKEILKKKIKRKNILMKKILAKKIK